MTAYKCQTLLLSILFLHGKYSNYFDARHYTTDVTCNYRPIKGAEHTAKSLNRSRSNFILAFASNNQEIENIYVSNSALYARVLQYLNYDIAHDVYLCLPGRLDSVAAIAVSYPRQYGSTGRSSVLLVFPVPDKALLHGCYVTFQGSTLELDTRRFVFTAQDIKAARQGQVITK